MGKMKEIATSIQEIERKFDKEFVIGDNGDLFHKTGRGEMDIETVDDDNIKSFYRKAIQETIFGLRSGK
jgi:hypothetical protein